MRAPGCMQQDVFLHLPAMELLLVISPFTAAASDFYTFFLGFGDPWDPCPQSQPDDHFQDQRALWKRLGHVQVLPPCHQPWHTYPSPQNFVWCLADGSPRSATRRAAVTPLVHAECSGTSLHIPSGFSWEEGTTWRLPLCLILLPECGGGKIQDGWTTRECEPHHTRAGCRGNVGENVYCFQRARRVFKCNNGTWLPLKTSKALKNGNPVSRPLSAPQTLKCITIGTLFLRVPLQMTPGKHQLLPVGFCHHPFPSNICICFQIRNRISLIELWSRIYVTPFRFRRLPTRR